MCQLLELLVAAVNTELIDSTKDIGRYFYRQTYIENERMKTEQK
jgi:hypothetical protein